MNVVRRAVRAVFRRWRRNALTITAVAIGAATIVAMVAISQASALRVIERLTTLETNIITAGLPSASWEKSEVDLISGLSRSPGVVGVGTLVLPAGGDAGATLSNPITGERVTSGVAVATNQGLAARGVTFREGAGFPPDAVLQRDPYVLLIGTRLAAELGYAGGEGAMRLELDGVHMTVAGVIADGADGTILSTSVVLSPQGAAAVGRTPPNRAVSIRVADGQAAAVSVSVPLLLDSSDPEGVSVLFSSSPQQLRAELLADSNALVVVIGWVMIGVTAFSIVTTMQIAVNERRKEIGIARAIGQTRISVALGFLFEALLLGAVGSTIGLIVGVIVAAAATALAGWQFVLPPGLLTIPVLGLLLGAAAGFWPALTASKTEPADLLRS